MSPNTPRRGTGNHEPWKYVTGGQEFVRDTKYIETRITADGRDGYPVQAGRYRLVATCGPAALGQPHSDRPQTLGLGGRTVAEVCADPPRRGIRGRSTSIRADWTSAGHPRIKDAYERRSLQLPKGITVPAIVDIPTGAVVTNDFPQMTIDFSLGGRTFTATVPRVVSGGVAREIDEGQQGRVPRSTTASTAVDLPATRTH